MKYPANSLTRLERPITKHSSDLDELSHLFFLPKEVVKKRNEICISNVAFLSLKILPSPLYYNYKLAETLIQFRRNQNWLLFPANFENYKLSENKEEISVVVGMITVVRLFNQKVKMTIPQFLPSEPFSGCTFPL